jgi:hypothetical protein
MIDYVKQYRPDIQAIDFYIEDQLMTLQVGSSLPVPYDTCKLPPEKRLAYFDHVHTFAANIPQPYKGKELELLGKKHILANFMQEVFRMRGLKNFQKLLGSKGNGETPDELAKSDLQNNQSFHVVLTPDVAAELAPYISNEGKLEIDTLLDVLEANQNDMLKPHHYNAYQQQIKNIVLNAVRDKILFAKNIHTSRKIAHEFRSLIVTEMEDDPGELYGKIEQDMPIEKVIELAKKNALKQIQDSPRFTQEEIADLNAKMDALPLPPMPKEIRMTAEGNSILTELNKEMHVQQNRANNTQITMSQELNLNLHISHQLRQVKQGEFIETEWSDKIDSLKFEEWFKVERPEKETPQQRSRLNKAFGFMGSLVKKIIAAKPLLPSLFFLSEQIALSKNAIMQKISNAFDSRIWFTNNFIPLLGKPETLAEIGSEFQRELFQVLVHVDLEDDGKMRISSVGCLSQRDAVQWRKKLNGACQTTPQTSRRAFLYDMNTRSIVSGHQVNRDLLHKDKEFLLIETQLNFLNGNENYTSDQKTVLIEWIKKMGVSKMKDAFYAIHAERAHRPPLHGTGIDYIFHELEGTPLKIN